ncbi:hypothetical protein ACTXT7_009058 [Hymenolepis weldensis]
MPTRESKLREMSYIPMLPHPSYKSPSILLLPFNRSISTSEVFPLPPLPSPLSPLPLPRRMIPADDTSAHDCGRFNQCLVFRTVNEGERLNPLPGLPSLPV